MLDLNEQELSRATTFLNREHGLLIDGKLQDPIEDGYLDIVDPSTERKISVAAQASARDVDCAVLAARRAFESTGWSSIKPTERARMLYRVADLIEANARELAYLETLDNGKPYSQSLPIDVDSAVGSFRYYAGWADKIRGSSIELSIPGVHHAFTKHEPIGVVGLIVPWNFPLAMAANKLAPALAAGCTCILKPAEETSLTALRLGELILEAGIPQGVVNVLTGRGHVTGAALVEHSGIDKISFTGSTEVGKRIVRASADNLKKVTLELGGKSPNIVLPDADIEKAIEGIGMGIFFNSGQVCIATSRLYVHEDIHDDVVAGITGLATSLKLGPGVESDSVLGPIVSETQMHRVLDYVAKGRDEGANVAIGGERADRTGYFVPPTVLTNCTNSMAVSREEIFGPVLAVQKFSDVNEAVRLANDSSYGLSASVWTQNVNSAHDLASRLQAGYVGVNAAMALDRGVPIGGYKQSGWGRENGPEGLLAFTETKSVAIAIN